ncbi:Predicted SnoaL-like aldol condensation-catalyzing enzyme [Mucilaginibacter gossypiicola]|uniref:Predicted SnoaL-like aldol condensation-catalyzing enzyme n=1 Tax=Mucilaginibacter gossypiicola TaxID=551995 RepID=A0A1H8GES2_9SPHI|nr:nuclear transport factor 2 family protein [Mucilaginibacter gossypiicola]SEN42641.1 Predicted SnoaL-like aldol condensation-catalyzing enzyme [Mucilaginibacter gossypiicola]
MKITPILALGVCCILICNALVAKSHTYMDTITNKQKVLSFYKQIVGQRKTELIPEFIIEDYRQHNPTVKQGRAGITEMVNYLKTLPLPSEGAKSPIIRAIQEGDFVVTHLDIQFMGKRMAVIDLFKLKDGMLTEHWDAIQPLPDESGKETTSTNGTAEIDHHTSAENSKLIVDQFYKAILNKQSANQFIDAAYIEHDAAAAAPGVGLAGYLGEPERAVKIHRIIAEGDFVAVQSQFSRSGKTFVFNEIFRVAGRKIAEHWSVEQAIPDGVKPEDMF